MTFGDLHLSAPLLSGLNGAGFLRPSPVQWQAIPPAKLGLDLLVQSKSGTGKTLVFAIAAIQVIEEAEAQNKGVQVSQVF